MASRKDDKKESTPAKPESGGEAPRSFEDMERQQREAISRSLDESKENLRKTPNEAEQEIPKYTQVLRDYQTKSIDASRDIAESYLDSQKQAINSMQSTWSQNVRQMESWWGFPMSPQAAAELFSRMATTIADATIAASKTANKMMFANMEAAAITMNQIRESAKEMARINANLFATMGRTSRETAERSRMTY
jgi:hypothetical protein